jgi:hypothetical protein
LVIPTGAKWGLYLAWVWRLRIDTPKFEIQIRVLILGCITTPSMPTSQDMIIFLDQDQPRIMNSVVFIKKKKYA